MNHRIVKRLFIASALLIALPVLASASTSRLAGMGTQGDYTKDYTNIFGYPSCVSQVGNLVYGEFGQVTSFASPYNNEGNNGNYSEYFQTEDRSVGAVLGNLFDGKYGTFAFHMREYSPALGTGSQPWIGYDAWQDEYLFGTGFETFSGYNRPLDPNGPGRDGYTPYFNQYGTESFDLMWGKKCGKTSLGLRLNRSNYKYTYDANGTASDYTDEGYEPYDRNIFGFGFGLGYENSEKLSTELGVLYQSRTFKYSNSSGVTESDGGGAYLVSLRAMYQAQPALLVVPVIRFYSFDRSSKYTASTTSENTSWTQDYKQSGWQAGVAGNWTVNQKDLFIAGVTFASNTWDNKGTVYKNDPTHPSGVDKFTESIMPTLFASLETKINPWWTLRFGGKKGVFYSTKDEYLTGTSKQTTEEHWSPFQFFLGTGVKFGTLQMDATLAQDFFHNPSTYVGAPSSTGNYFSPLFPKVTATYSF